MGFRGLLVLTLSIINLLVMLWNFLKAPDKFYGKYPKVFCILKPLIVPLMALYLSVSMETISPYLSYFCLFSWLGDIALLWTTYLANTVGGVMFFFAQLSIVAFYNVPLQKTSPLAVALFLPSAFVLIGYLVPLIVRKRPEYLGAVIYLTALNAALGFAVQRCVVMSPFSIAYIFGFIGHQLFVVSDVVLVRGLMLHRENTENFVIILTYVLALWFISISVASLPSEPVVPLPSAPVEPTE